MLRCTFLYIVHRPCICIFFHLKEWGHLYAEVVHLWQMVKIEMQLMEFDVFRGKNESLHLENIEGFQKVLSSNNIY